MGRPSQYKKGICYSKEYCINGGGVANEGNPDCWLPGSDEKVFCSKQCLDYYTSNRDKIEKERTEYERLKKLRQRRIKNIVNAMYFSSGRKIDKKILKKIVLDLGLFSAFLDGNVPNEITMFLKLKGKS